MTIFAQLTTAAGDALATLEETLPSKIMEIDEKLGALQAAPLETAAANFRAGFDAKKALGNKEIDGLLPVVRQYAASSVLDLRKIERWIILNIPKVEDGNNFGVAIQHEVSKMVVDQRKEIGAMFDKLADYHKERAVLVEKVAAKQSTETSEATSEGKDSETKAGEATETAKKSTKKDAVTKSTQAAPLADALEAVVDLDVKWFFFCTLVLETIRDSYICCGDVLEKNRLKLAQPKGDGSTRMNMF